MSSAGTVIPDASVKRAVADLVKNKGAILAASKALGLSSDSVVRLMAGAPVRRVTLDLAKIRLKEIAEGTR